MIDDISKEDSSAVGVSWHLGELPELTRKKFIYTRLQGFEIQL